MRKNSFTFGVIILMSANVITRLMGFVYRILMSKSIGTQGMGLYQLIMPVYMLCYSVSASGITTTVSKLTAEQTGRFSSANSMRILKLSLSISLFLSFSLSIMLFIFSDYIAINFIKDTRTALSLKVLSTCIPFMAAGSCIKGYFLGKQTNLFPALSQVFEQSVRIISLFAITYIIKDKSMDAACAAAVLTVSIGEILSFLLILIFLCTAKESSDKKPTISSFSAYKNILRSAVPLSASRVSSSLLAAFENILIPQKLSLYNKYAANNSALSTYGSLTGMIMPLIHFPSSLLNAVSINLVPAISKQRKSNNKSLANNTIKRSLTFTLATSFGAAAFFYIFAKEICSLIYSNENLYVLLKPVSLLCPIMYMHITLNGILNSLGKHMTIFVLNILSSISNIFVIYFLMPVYGLTAFFIGFSLSASICVVPSFYIANQYFDIAGFVFKTSVLCILSALISSFMVYISPASNHFFLMLLMISIYLLSLTVFGITKDII